MMKEIIQNELSKVIHLDIVKEIMKEYGLVSKSFYLGDNEKVLSSSGRFVDLVLAGICYWYDQNLLNLNNLNFENLFRKVTNLPRKKNNGEEDLLLHEIPHVAKAVYTLRNKKRGAHRKDFDPIIQDRVFLKESVDWILSSLLFVFHTRADQEIKVIIENLIQKKVPFIEEFEDGGIKVLKKMSFGDRLLLILYRQGTMINRKELRRLSKPNYPQEFNTNLNNLDTDLLVYTNKENIKITQNGIKEVEEKILKEK